MPPFALRFNESDDDSVDEHRETVNCLKRRISELESQEKKAQSKSNVASQVKSFANLGRAICKVVSTFDSVESLIAEDDRRCDLEDARTRGDEVHEEEEVPTIEQDILHNGYKELCRFIVPLRKLLAEADHEELAPVLSALRSGSRNARSDDTKNVREAIVPWLVAALPELSPTLDLDSRENRGIYHDDLGRLLCPVEFDWNDQSVRTAIREGDPNYLITAGSWWAGLYPPGKFDPARPEAHLFTNVLLLKTYKFIFTSPLSVKTMPKDKEIPTLSPTHRGSGSRPQTKSKKLGSKSKRNVAAIVGLRTVTGRSIAYAAYRVALSDANHWDDQDGGFDYCEFYNNIVEYFEFPPGPVARNEVARLLDWWNTNVFGTTPRWSLYEEHESRLSRETRETSSVALMRAARLARESDV
ncbi:hypothetical protein MVEN_01401800 [Mycena venus]|uniref:Uncharacterized protein n=1 Tax=Mycena venus TaxID=2733690 RepID=A0A8H6XWF4_9AGAR|nr:hypothetical protein MVEN_01401800 [Mycena venus]